MATKANRSRAAKVAGEAAARIEKAKKSYGVAEVKADNVILRLASRLADSPYTLAISAAALIGVIVLLIL